MRTLVLTAVAGLVAACAVPPNDTTEGVMAPGEPQSAISGTTTDREPGMLPAHGLRLPATFRGDLPCADCEGIRHHLDLWPDQVFHLRREWLGKDLTRADIGRWRVDPGRRALILQGGAEMPLQFEIKGGDRLRLLDLEGQPIVSDLPYELLSDGTLQPAELSLFMAGEAITVDDAMHLTECLTGRGYRIRPGDAALELQRAYLATVRQPGAPLYVSFEGTLAPGSGTAAGGSGAEPAVTVERFVGAWPNQSCERGRATASLLNTYWRIVQLRGEALQPTAGRREPHVLLRDTPDGPGYAATVGCNQLVGKLHHEGEQLRFAPGAATLMACPEPLGRMERQLVDALHATRRAHIQGNTLVLRDSDGNDLALLEAVYF